MHYFYYASMLDGEIQYEIYLESGNCMWNVQPIPIVYIIIDYRHK